MRWLLFIGALLIGASAYFSQKVKKTFLSGSQVDPSTAAADPEPSSTAESTEMPQTGPLLSYFILSDLHVSVGDPQTKSKLRQALDDITHFDSPVDAIIMTGDLTDTGTERDYKELHTIVNEYKLPPVHANMGNHDYYTIWINQDNSWDQKAVPNGKTDALSREQFMKFFGYSKPYNEYKVKNHTMLLLSQEAYVQEKPEVGEGAWYSDDQLAWFKASLKANYVPGRPLFVMTHQPLPVGDTNGATHQLIRAREFRAALKPYKNVFVFCGHRHMDFQNGVAHYVQETFHYFHNSSVGRPLNKAYQQEVKHKSQGLYVQVYADKVVLRGREFSNRTYTAEADWTIELQKANA
ncbi:metallophosphoesterase family protein [Paenibacillus hexagrammi]|uniref:metallophosphoesterase family protein n=1 Tax=Paenibacillus hexagrammi TaxID=2908839 RepID=UPI0028830F84|nr:metallophosphoesterase [Paenibacillus sp. YPD9-1]